MTRRDSDQVQCGTVRLKVWIAVVHSKAVGQAGWKQHSDGAGFSATSVLAAHSRGSGYLRRTSDVKLRTRWSSTGAATSPPHLNAVQTIAPSATSINLSK